ncbi:HEXXH motif domain-containing protein [Amorphoplanes nipponensis]|uniref:HEXXH motif domain-containing protein n=1 Tax=Actinoplanes nipponensis TaxID=135950 RepID=A0A919MM74_9ACTN|nr:HEXXH motif-containing putative peptide modification protein [Actinoplanes nipponensis]GIE49567.1 HEXXH motif domain-containing protein [Actinoplanes nipponensis]
MITDHYVLTAAQFDGLAAGYGTPDALAMLRQGQLAKRKILLQGVLAAYPGPAVDLLLRAEEADAAVTGEVLRHPHVDAWAAQALRHGTAFGYLAQLAAAAAVRAGLSFAIDAPVSHGWAYLPGLGAVPADGGTVTVTPAVLGADGWEPLRSVELEPGYAVAIEDLEPFRDTYHWRPAPRLDAAAFAHAAALLRDAWQILTRRHPEHAAAMRVLLRSVVPLLRPESGASVSAASRQASGSVAVVITDTAEELSLLLLHEFMHMKLDALRDLVDLHASGAAGRFLAPWRMDPRPVGPLFQGVYAHTGVTDYWRARRGEPDAPAVAELEFAYWRRQSAIAAESLAESGELTTEGERFVRGLRETLGRWEREAVAPDVADKADAMVLAQTVRWRLRNWRPSRTELAEMTGAWQAGSTPVARKSGVLRTDADGEPSGMPGLVGLIRSSRVSTPETADKAAAALLAGHPREACSAYTLRVTTGHPDDDSLIGWAVAAAAVDPDLAVALRMRPDLAQEALRSIRDTDQCDFLRCLGRSLRMI